MSQWLEWLAAAGYVALALYGIWLFADALSDWLARRIKHD